METERSNGARVNSAKCSENSARALGDVEAEHGAQSSNSTAKIPDCRLGLQGCTPFTIAPVQALRQLAPMCYPLLLLKTRDGVPTKL